MNGIIRVVKLVVGLLIILGLAVGRADLAPNANASEPTITAVASEMPPPMDTPVSAPDAEATQQFALAVLSYTPVPSPTPAPPLPSVSLLPLFYTTRVTPPFLLQLTGVLHKTSSTGECASAKWNWGDGATENIPCLKVENAEYKGEHTYIKPGMYTAELLIELTDGQTVVRDSRLINVVLSHPIDVFKSPLAWTLWVLSLIAVAAVVRWLRKRRTKRWAWAGMGLLVLAVFTFLPPFSYVPNPLGVYWARFGGYSFDPRLPFWNGFVVASPSLSQLEGRLDSLMGQTGLDPLDPAQPLAGYQFTGIGVPDGPDGYSRAVTEMTYADGTRRSYAIPLYHDSSVYGAYRFYRGWGFFSRDGMGRLFTKHDEFPETPFPLEDGSIHLATPQRLALHPNADKLDTLNPGNWVLGYWNSTNRLVWSPEGDAFLIVGSAGGSGRNLWLVKLDGSPPDRIAESAFKYDWSPDGRYIVYNQLTQSQNYPVFVAARDTHERREVAQLRELYLPGITREGLWYADQNTLWLVPFDGGPRRKAATLWNSAKDMAVRPSPDGKRLAYVNEGQVYFQDIDGKNRIQKNFRAKDLAWSRDGKFAAFTNGFGELWVVSSSGDAVSLYNVTYASEAITDSIPQWSPDGRFIFLQSYAYGGRRIVAYDWFERKAFDMTLPRWDAWFSLSPDGKYLLLSNGRGGFWRSDLIMK